MKRILALGFFLNLVLFSAISFSQTGALPPGCAAGFAAETGAAIYKCLDWSYTSPASGSYKYDLFLPSNFLHSEAGSLPGVIYIHGGAWSGSRASSSASSERLAGLGYIVANIDYYTVNVSHQYLNQSQKWTISRNAPKDIAYFIDNMVFNTYTPGYFKLNQSRISLVGVSAGAHLALMEASRGRNQYQAVLVGSAPTNIDKLSIYAADPDFRYAVRNIFGDDLQFKSAMSPSSNVANLRVNYLYMEHSTTDNLSPFADALGFYFDARMPSSIVKTGNAVAGDSPQLDVTGAYTLMRHYMPSSFTSQIETKLVDLLNNRF